VTGLAVHLSCTVSGILGGLLDSVNFWSPRWVSLVAALAVLYRGDHFMIALVDALWSDRL